MSATRCIPQKRNPTSLGFNWVNAASLFELGRPFSQISIQQFPQHAFKKSYKMSYSHDFFTDTLTNEGERSIECLRVSWTRGSVSFNWVHVINIRASGGRFIDPIPSPLSLVQVLLLAKIETVMEVRIFLEKTFREAYFMYPLSTVHWSL